MTRSEIAARSLLPRCLAVLTAGVLVVGWARSSKADDPSRPPILSAREDTPQQ